MFAYLISEVLCNIYQVCRQLNNGESCFSELTATFGSGEVSLESIFKAPGRKIICYEFILSLLRKYESSHFFAWLVHMRRHAVTADKNYIPINTHESRFSKSTEQIKSKNISFERFFKAQDS